MRFFVFIFLISQNSFSWQSEHFQLLKAVSSSIRVKSDKALDNVTLRNHLIEILFYSKNQFLHFNSINDVASINVLDYSYDGIYNHATINMNVAWPINQEIPNYLQLGLPNSIHHENTFFSDHYKCGSSVFNDPKLFIRTFNPYRKECDFFKNPKTTGQIVNLDLQLINKKETFPNYQLLPSTKLNVGIIWERNIHNQEYVSRDQGLESFVRFYDKLVTHFGKPMIDSDPPPNREFLSSQVKLYQWSFQYLKKTIEVKVLLGNSMDLGNGSGLSSPDLQYLKFFKDITSKSDFISFNGHQIDILNTRYMANFGSWTNNHYQVIYLGTCSGYHYVGLDLFFKKQYLDPDLKINDRLDLIVNGYYTNWNKLPAVNVILIQSLVEGKDSYKEIFKKARTYNEVSKLTGKPYSNPGLIVVGDK